MRRTKSFPSRKYAPMAPVPAFRMPLTCRPRSGEGAALPHRLSGRSISVYTFLQHHVRIHPWLSCVPWSRTPRQELVMMVPWGSGVYELFPWPIWISQTAPKGPLDYSCCEINYILIKKFYEKFLEVSFFCETLNLIRFWNILAIFCWFQDFQIWALDFSAFLSSSTLFIRLFPWGLQLIKCTHFLVTLG